MPTLPLPAGGSAITAENPINDAADVLALMPAVYRKPDIAAVRDALVAAAVALSVAYQDASAYAAAQSDLATAAGLYLEALAADRELYRKPKETIEEFRQRVLAIPDLVTPAAIISVVNAILAPHTTAKAQLCESIADRMYLRRNAASPGACASFPGADPSYFTRLYEVDKDVNGGVFRPQSSPGGAIPFRNHVGRLFLLRVPDISPRDRNINGLWPAVNGSPTTPGKAFVGRTQPGKLFTSLASATALDVYRAISTAVDAIRAHSIRWIMLSDSSLN